MREEKRMTTQWESQVKSPGITASAVKCCSVIGWQVQELLIEYKNRKCEPHRCKCANAQNNKVLDADCYSKQI